ncbi:hypothetical protein DFP72DRAFT_1033987 [Ephemerocybe angulata]|uniref:Uncharacterized protein n=1 Tax=Ephemerocybe angulata TaxID=980116 RepID=A0A8H6HSJ7_9AGAR|nr:hypothetical protein DFP72DRAFT_1033987 [Tulosesus angulatus]
MDQLVATYMRWIERLNGESFDNAVPTPASADASNAWEVQVLDSFRTYRIKIAIEDGDFTPACSLLREGLVGNVPIKPSFAVSLRTLEIYRTVHLRSPHLALEPYIKSLCDIYGASYRTALREVLSACYDLYLRLRDEVELRVTNALDRTGLWRVKNVCPACTYKLEGEDTLLFSILVTMDGNDSLKRIIRRSLEATQVPLDDDEMQPTQTQPGASAERNNGRTVDSDGVYYISREQADRQGKEHSGQKGPELAEEEETHSSACAGRWQNMKKEVTEKMWGIFDETGIFLCLCRHGFVIALLDMVRSGELSKYPLAVVETLLDAFGSDIGCGYDIGCQFATTIRQSSLGARATKARFRSLVGSFHGHAHNRTCQLSNLAMYVEGLGLEDLEGCERFFSKSNALAGPLRHASVFHRQQAILQYVKHTDRFETSQNLSKFLVNNYKQALSIIEGEAELRRSMESRGIPSTETFHKWLQDEREYLEGLKNEPLEETMRMDYYQKLVELRTYEEAMSTVLGTFIGYDPSKPGRAKGRKSPEAQRRAAQENVDRTLRVVQDLEIKLDIKIRWTADSDEWKKEEARVARRTYQRCLDELERLIVSRMFELTKMNMSGTGYKLRKHIAKALQARSQAIRTALERYNAAAKKLKRSKLTWEQVVEYAFLSDFDLLRDTREDVRERPWATPVNRVLMDQYFKIKRAREEIVRLNIEIKRVVTHMQDEENFLLAMEERIFAEDRTLAFHVANYRIDRTRFFPLHLRRFNKLSKLPGFTGSIVPGTAVDSTLRQTSSGSAESNAMAVDPRSAEGDWQDDDDDEAERRHQAELDFDEEEDLDTAFNVLRVADD